MRTKEELNALREEVASVQKKLGELTEEELREVTGGLFSMKQNILPHNFPIEEFPAPIISGIEHNIFLKTDES